MTFKEKIQNSTHDNEIVIYDSNDIVICHLSLITSDDLNDKYLITKMTEWRKQFQHCFLTVFEPTYERTKTWLEKRLCTDENRVLFKIYSIDRKLIGHIGAINYNSYIEYDYYIKGERVAIKDFAQIVAKRFLFWICDVSSVEDIFGRVRSDNNHTIEFHQRTGFQVVGRKPLKKHFTNNVEYDYYVDEELENADLFLLEIHMKQSDIKM